MRISKTRLAYMVMLVLALGVLLWDKTIAPQSASGPKSAQGRTRPPGSKGNTARRPKPAAAPATPAPADNEGPVWTDNLDHLVDADTKTGFFTGRPRDLFIPAPALLDELTDTQDDNQMQKQQEYLLALQARNRRNLLSAAAAFRPATIVWRPQQPQALVHGRIVGINDSIGPFQVCGIEPDGLVLALGPYRVHVGMETAPVFVSDDEAPDAEATGSIVP